MHKKKNQLEVFVDTTSIKTFKNIQENYLKKLNYKGLTFSLTISNYDKKFKLLKTYRDAKTRAKIYDYLKSKEKNSLHKIVFYKLLWDLNFYFYIYHLIKKKKNFYIFLKNENIFDNFFITFLKRKFRNNKGIKIINYKRKNIRILISYFFNKFKLLFYILTNFRIFQKNYSKNFYKYLFCEYFPNSAYFIKDFTKYFRKNEMKIINFNPQKNKVY